MKQDLALELTARILDLPEVELRKSRFSKAEAFFFGKREIAHFHNANEIDIRVTKPVISRLGLKKGVDKRVVVRTPSSEWAELTFRSEQDLGYAIELIELAVKANTLKKGLEFR